MFTNKQYVQILKKNTIFVKLNYIYIGVLARLRMKLKKNISSNIIIAQQNLPFLVFKLIN